MWGRLSEKILNIIAQKRYVEDSCKHYASRQFLIYVFTQASVDIGTNTRNMKHKDVCSKCTIHSTM